MVSMAEWAAYYAKDPDAREDKISMVVLDVSDVPAIVERVTAPRVVSEIDWANLMAPLPETGKIDVGGVCGVGRVQAGVCVGGAVTGGGVCGGGGRRREGVWEGAQAGVHLGGD